MRWFLKNARIFTNRRADLSSLQPDVDTQILVPRLPKVTTAISELEQTTADLELPFEPLTEIFELDDKEGWWADRWSTDFAQMLPNGHDWSEGGTALEATAMSEGCREAAQAKFRRGEDFDGALRSWLRMFAIIKTFDVNNKEFGTLTISKNQWLLLAKIYVGLKDYTRAEKAIAWAEVVNEAEKISEIDDESRELLMTHWAEEVAEVSRQIQMLKRQPSTNPPY